MTWEWFSDVFRFNIDGNLGQSEFLPYCWPLRDMMARFLEKRRLPQSPALFGPSAHQPTSVPHVREEAHSPAPLGKYERKRLAVDAAIRTFGVDALMPKCTQKAREQTIKELAEPQLGGLTISAPAMSASDWHSPRSGTNERNVPRPRTFPTFLATNRIFRDY